MKLTLLKTILDAFPEDAEVFIFDEVGLILEYEGKAVGIQMEDSYEPEKSKEAEKRGFLDS